MVSGTIKTLAELRSLKGSNNQVVYCEEVRTRYRFKTGGSSYNVTGLSVVSTGSGGDSRWVAISGKYKFNPVVDPGVVRKGDQVAQSTSVKTKASLRSFGGYDGLIVRCLELKTSYKYFSFLTNVAVNGSSVISSANNPDARWVGVEGEQMFSNLENYLIGDNHVGSDLAGNFSGSGTGTGTGPGEIEIQDEGISVTISATVLNFVGDEVTATDQGGGVVDIFVGPPPDFASNFNDNNGRTDARVSDIATSFRRVAAPTSEGTPYKIGNWNGNDLRACTRTGTWTYSTSNPCSFENNVDTTIEVNVADPDGTVANHLTSAITGDIDVTVDNIRIRVTSFQADSTKFQGVVTVDINMSAINSNGGRHSITLIHHNGGTDYVKTQSDVFYDVEPTTQTITGVTIAENTPSIRYVDGGIEYYDVGSTFDIDIADMDNLNANSYPTNFVSGNYSEYGISNENLQGSNLTGWTSIHNNVDASYSATKAISQTNYRFLGNDANISAQVTDWTAGASAASPNASIYIDTFNSTSTNTFESFNDTTYRVTYFSDGPGGLDDPNAAYDSVISNGTWDPSVFLGADDALFFNGGCERNSTNHQPFSPGLVSNPNYSASQNSTVYLVRKFVSSGPASNVDLTVVGSYDSIEYKLANSWDGTNSGGTVWVDALQTYAGPGAWNNGNPSTGGGQLASAGNTLNLTFGTNNIVNTGNVVYVRIGLSGSQRITGLSVNFP